MCFLKNDPRSDDFAIFSVRDRDCSCFSDRWRGSKDILDLDRKEVLIDDEVNEDEALTCVIQLTSPPRMMISYGEDEPTIRHPKQDLHLVTSTLPSTSQQL